MILYLVTILSVVAMHNRTNWSRMIFYNNVELNQEEHCVEGSVLMRLWVL